MTYSTNAPARTTAKPVSKATQGNLLRRQITEVADSLAHMLEDDFHPLLYVLLELHLDAGKESDVVYGLHLKHPTRISLCDLQRLGRL